MQKLPTIKEVKSKKPVGRVISLGECEFVFKGIWNATLECSLNQDHDPSH